jgi:TusA-related sulfurtransferase
VVSKGAQKNFAEFAKWIGQEWEKTSDAFNEMFYRQAIAKAIIFRSVEKLVTDAPWYQGGYRANIVAYAISKLAYDLMQQNINVDFEKVWKSQGLPTGLSEALAVSAQEVHEVLVNTPATLSNVTEWAKQQACWERVKLLEIFWPASLKEVLITTEEEKSSRKFGIKDQKMVNGIEAQAAVVQAGARLWEDVIEWGSERGLLTQKEISILTVATKAGNIPSDKQSILIMNTLLKLHEEGCQLGMDII